MINRSALSLVLDVWGLVRIGLRSIALEAFRHSLERYEDPLSERTPGGTTHLGGHCKKTFRWVSPSKMIPRLQEINIS